MLQLLSSFLSLRDYIDEEIENICLRNGRGHVTSLKRPSAVFLREDPSSVSNFYNEQLTGLRKERRSLRTNHPHILITLHYLLYPGERELVVSTHILRTHLLNFLELGEEQLV